MNSSTSFTWTNECSQAESHKIRCLSDLADLSVSPNRVDSILDNNLTNYHEFVAVKQLTVALKP